MNNFGETLKKLRRQKDMTQEQLAEYVNISPQSVSKWETNLTLPDITIIPMLANIFDVSADVLLGIDIDAKEKCIEAITKEAADYRWKKRNDEAEKLLRAALKEYPNSYILMNSLVSLLSSNMSYHIGNRSEAEMKAIEEEKKTVREEIVALCEKILAGCTDDLLRHSTIEQLCITYVSMGETEKAASFANKMPHKHFSRENLITRTLKGTKQYNHIQKELAHSVCFDVLNSIASLIHIALDDGTEAYSLDERMALYRKIIDIANIFVEKGSFGDLNWWLAAAHQNLTFLYIQKNDTAAALNHFRLTAKHSIIQDSMPPVGDASEEYASLLFRGLKYPFIQIDDPSTMTESALEMSRALESVLPAPEIEEIRNELLRQAEIN